MIELIKITSHPELVAEIVKQFVFMRMMSKPGDSNFYALQELDLNDVTAKADNFFIDLCDFEELITDTRACHLKDKIGEFLREWAKVVDVIAIQQNVHYELSVLEKHENG